MMIAVNASNGAGKSLATKIFRELSIILAKVTESLLQESSSP